MKLLLDQGLPRGAVRELALSGHDAVHTGDLQLADAPDAEILARALQEDRIVVTLDADFHALLAAAGSTKPSVVRIREEGLKGHDLADLLRRIGAQFSLQLEAGCVLTYARGQIRARKLPIG
jgi:predicted nuclease of predicted toxin-antitoxin system